MSSDLLYQNIADELNLGKLLSKELIQTLWSGYGELVRLKFSRSSIIIKHINLSKVLEHPRGWNTSFSHLRKVHSYEVEVNWYENFTKDIDEKFKMPKGLKTFKTKDEWLIVMEDLLNYGFIKTTLDANKLQIVSTLNWLANFHAKHLGVKSDKLWENGTYWHLDTRPDEFEALEDKKLKIFAKKIDEKLKNTKYQTIVHGDAKLANFCFNQAGNTCAAVDFQYVGHGCGMKDLAYFITSAVEPKHYEQKWILDTYFEAFHKALTHYKIKVNGNELENEWRSLFPFAWADFQRFIKGWSPKHYKINTYSDNITNQALRYLEMEEN